MLLVEYQTRTSTLHLYLRVDRISFKFKINIGCLLRFQLSIAARAGIAQEFCVEYTISFIEDSVTINRFG